MEAEMSEKQVFFQVFTWEKDSHGLFDYESVDLIQDKFTVEDSICLIRDFQGVRLGNESEKEKILRIRKENEGFFIFPGELQIWKVVDQEAGVVLKKGDFLKFGRVKYRVKELCATESEAEEVRKKEKKKICRKMQKDKEGHTCRLCFSEEEIGNPLISPCNCGGTMKFIHLLCFKKWLALKTIAKQNIFFTKYSFQDVTCEISRCQLANSLFLDDSQPNFIEMPIKTPPYLALEYFNKRKNTYHICILSFAHKTQIVIGRGHENQVILPDLSISRCHSSISLIGNLFTLHDLHSKFGTLIKTKQGNLTQNNSEIVIQTGRSLIFAKLLEKTNFCSTEHYVR